MERRNLKYILTAACLSLLFAGCSDSSDERDDDTPPNGETPSNTVQIDASAGGVGASPTDPLNKYTYFDLDTGRVVELTDAEAALDTVWDIAFKRTKTKINGGASGPGSVTAALADEQDDFYDSAGDPDNNVFMNATAESEEAAFDDFTDASTLNFVADEDKPRIDGSLQGDETWALYDPVTHSISAQPDAWNIVKSADGKAFAKLHVINITQASRDITLEMFIQQEGEVVFDTTATEWTASIGQGGGSRCFDFESESEVDCTTESAGWDVMVEVSTSGYEWNMWTNGGIRGSGQEGGSYGTIQSTDFNYTGVGDGQGLFPERYLEADAPTGVFIENSWYAYNLAGNHKLWPNYRVFAVGTGSAIYKLQFLSYYDETGESGNLTIRFEAL